MKYHPGCFIQYFDDTPAKDPAKALSADRFVLAVARHKQLTRCSVCYSLQAFQGRRTKDGLLCYRNMGVDVDLAPPAGEDGTPFSTCSIEKPTPGSGWSSSTTSNAWPAT